MARPATRVSRPSVSDRPSVRRPRAVAVASSPQNAPASAPPPPAPSGPTIVQSSDKTVREVIPPWHVIQKKMADKEAEKKAKEERAVLEIPPPPAPEALLALSAFEEVAPESGVRLSDAHLLIEEPANDGARSDSQPDDGLSFKVYTLADLERRSDAPMAMSMRASRMFEGSASMRTHHARRAKDAVVAFFKAALAWYRTSKMEREPAKIALRQPFDVMGDELELVVRTIDWKKVGVRTGIVVGASLTLLFTVLTAAELTDDLRPSGKAQMNLQSSGNVTAPPLAAAPLPPAPVAIAPAPAAPAPAAEDPAEVEPPAPKKVVAATKKPAAAPAKKKLAYRNADDVFKP